MCLIRIRIPERWGTALVVHPRARTNNFTHREDARKKENVIRSVVMTITLSEILGTFNILRECYEKLG